MPSSNEERTEQLQSLFDLTSRIDEKLKLFMERQADIERRIDKVLDNQQRDIALVEKDLNDLSEQVAIMAYSDPEIKKDLDTLKTKMDLCEIKVESINLRTQHADSRWGRLLDLIFKLGVMLVAGYILYKLGLQAPPS
jgi:hypothetical protein